MMRLLLLDTSSEYLLLGMQMGDSFYEEKILHENKLSEILLPSLAAFLEKQNILFNTLSGIAVGIGPGSYTGTRVAVTVAQALSFGGKIPLFTFCSLLCFLPKETGSFASLFSAKNGNIFILEGTKLQSLSEIKTTLLPQEDFIKRTSSYERITGPHPIDLTHWAPPAVTLYHAITSLNPVNNKSSCNVIYF